MYKIIFFFAAINLLVLIFFSFKGQDSVNTYEILERARVARDDHFYEKQRALLSQVIKDRIQVLGSEHAGLAKLYSRMAHSFLSSNNLESSLKDALENFDKAEEFVDKAIKIAIKQTDQQEWQLGLYVAQKGNILLEKAVRSSENVPQRAIMLLEQGLNILKTRLGVKSPEFQITKTILARALKIKGECNRSAELFAGTINWFENNLPPHSERLALQYEGLAKAQVCARQYVEAIKINELALTIYAGNGAYQESEAILNYRNGILNFLLGSYEKAFILLESAHEILHEDDSLAFLTIIKQDLKYLKAFTKSELLSENLLNYRAILRKRRLEHHIKSPKVQIFDPKMMVALEELIDLSIESGRASNGK